LVIHALYGEYWTGNLILERLGNAKIGRNDIVIFCQAGHGCIENAAQPIDSHLLQVGAREYLRRSQVRDALLKHPCRGIIIMTDCCSNIVHRSIPQSRSAENAGHTAQMNRQTVRNLFMTFRGFVDITAAEIGVAAANKNKLGNFGEARGAFTAAFLRAVCDEHVHQDWVGFFRSLQDMTHISSGGRQRACALIIRENAAPQARPIKRPTVAGSSMTKMSALGVGQPTPQAPHGRLVDTGPMN
jgi:hypothetical protein